MVNKQPINNTTDYVTKDQVYDKNFINQNYINKDILDHTQSSITLMDKRRIANIKPGISANDAVNKKQIEDYVNNLNRQITDIFKDRLEKAKDECTKLTDQLSRGKRSIDNSFLPFLDNDDVDFEDKRLRNVGEPIAPKDAINLEYITTNRITKVYLTGKLKNGPNPTFILTGGIDHFLCLYKGTVFDFFSFPVPDYISIQLNGKEVNGFDSFNFDPFNKITFHPKSGVTMTDGHKFFINLDIVYSQI
jgi:hypothetical protein